MKTFDPYEIWFVTGSQQLYGDETLRKVAEHSGQIAAALSAAETIPVQVLSKPVLTTPESIRRLMLDANSAPDCIGLILWMHTFSPAKMWIAGLKALQKPFLHLHTQFNRDIPWAQIDMDFMNLNQSAHGGREFGYICSRLKKSRKVVVGHWQDGTVREKINIWMRAAAAWQDSQNGKIARFGDNMRGVAVTEGDKLEAQLRFGYTVDGYGVGDLVEVMNSIGDSDIDRLIDEYNDLYIVAAEARKGGTKYANLRDAARIELGLRQFLIEGKFSGFTTTFENLHGLKQLPGLAVQRLMGAGYGFGAEGDWKVAALVRALKVISKGMQGGTSFMEDYTYHFDPAGMKVLGAHMLEVCESIAAEKPRLEVHPLSIGGKNDPPRLVFNTASGPALNLALIDLGNRFRMLVNKVEVVPPDAALPKLPVARVLWQPKPSLEVSAQCWILAGGSHHTAFSQAVSAEHIRDFADIAGVELLAIDEFTNVTGFMDNIHLNDVYYH